MRIFIASFPYLTMFLAVGVVRSFVPSAGRRRFLAPSVMTRSNAFTWNGQGHPRLFATTTNDNNNEDADADTEIEWTTNKVRSTFTSFFIDNYDHVFQPSAASAPLNDPTLLFTNAGMNQFKPIFLGQADPNSSLATLERATNSQKCIRAGGKHNDLEDVGRDTYHHTFFEMLGSWSFGDYFKQEAIDMAWELLTQVYKLDKERIYATYFEGDEHVPEDTEARDMWLKYLPADRVIGCNAEDNFWEVRIV